MDRFLFRDASKCDLDEILQLRIISENVLLFEDSVKFIIADKDKSDIVSYLDLYNLDYTLKKIHCRFFVLSEKDNKEIFLWGMKECLEMLKNRGWKFVICEIEKRNQKNISLYEELGFEKTCETEKYVYYEKRINSDETDKAVKVISCFLGNRRKAPGSPQQTFSMLQFLWEKEKSLDYGCPMDTLFIYNKLSQKEFDELEDKENYKKCEEFLLNLSDQKTKNGICLVIPRKNIGISFGAFDFAFHYFKQQYNYWLFLEDDQIIVKEGVMSQCIRQLMNPSFFYRPCGFCAVVGVSPESQYPAHAHGGCGCASRNVLNKVLASKSVFKKLLDTETKMKFDRPHLPFYILKEDDIFDKHIVFGEIPFTHLIYRENYNLVNIDMTDLIVIWGDEWKKNDRTISFKDYFNKRYPIDLDVIFKTTKDSKDDFYPKIEIYPKGRYYERSIECRVIDLSKNQIIYEKSLLLNNFSGQYYFFTIYNKIKELNRIQVEIYENNEKILSQEHTYDLNEKKTEPEKNNLTIINSDNSLFIVGCHIDSCEEQDLLMENLLKIKECFSSPILLVSHKFVDINILNLVDYFIYDRFNPLLNHKDYIKYICSTGNKLSNVFWFENSEIRIKRINEFRHDYAVWTSMQNAFNFAKYLEKKYIFYVEYDCGVIPDLFKKEFIEPLSCNDVCLMKKAVPNRDFVYFNIFSAQLDIILSFINNFDSMEKFYDSLSRFDFSDNQVEQLFRGFLDNSDGKIYYVNYPHAQIDKRNIFDKLKIRIGTFYGFILPCRNADSIFIFLMYFNPDNLEYPDTIELRFNGSEHKIFYQFHNDVAYIRLGSMEELSQYEDEYLEIFYGDNVISFEIREIIHESELATISCEAPLP